MEEEIDNQFRKTSLVLKELKAEEKELLRKQVECTAFKKKKLELEARKNWDCFYKKNQDKFFKDRNWTSDDLKESCPHLNLDDPLTYLDAGCGVGNMLFPLAQYFPTWKLQGFDFSDNAIGLLQERAKKESIPVVADVLDLTDNSKCDVVSSNFSTSDLTSLIFVLSAIHPEKHSLAIVNTLKFVKSGGTIFFRDYALYDHAMLRFGFGAKISENFYVRQDGTRAYFFTIPEITDLFNENNCEVLKVEYLVRKTINHSKKLCVDRLFLQGCFRKK
uniref:tRNA N(3)-methylcytidine methyltransferase n=1 Tax=Rhabditophanes sp. KR3021 TaxID=114890 RepID=A0AC35TUJ5_9BILA